MKPHDHLRLGKGYCCERCDGNYETWKKANKKSLKRRNRVLVEKEIKDQLEQIKTEES